MSQHNGDYQSSEPAAEALTALALNQLRGDEQAAAEAQLAAGGEAARREVGAIQSLSAALSAARSEAPLPSPSAELRKALEERLAKEHATSVALPPKRRAGFRIVLGFVAASLAAVLCAVLLPALQSYREAARRMASGNKFSQSMSRETTELRGSVRRHVVTGNAPQSAPAEVAYNFVSPPKADSQNGLAEDATSYSLGWQSTADHLATSPQATTSGTTVQLPQFALNPTDSTTPQRQTARLFASGDPNGKPAAADPSAAATVEMMVTPRIIIQAEDEVKLALEPARVTRKVKLSNGKDVYVTGTPAEEKLVAELAKNVSRAELEEIAEILNRRHRERSGTEQYDRIIENPFLAPRQQPLSTFSIDVDTASYANMRRFLTGGSLPPANAVRIEELVNYFSYDYPQPKAGEPFSVNMEVAECPWQTGHLLLRVGLKGKEVPRTERPPSNLVFLLDVSGSMSDENKLPLLKSAMKLLVGELGENDRVSIVTYAGDAGLRLPPTRGHDQSAINAAIDSLSANGSTNGSAGINLAYEQAAAYFVKGGTNRVILCTDGDLNVGVTSDDALVELIKQKATGGTFLTVLGFGEGNLKDAKLEKLADNGNGLYAYIDGVREARKVLVEQLTGSTITIAKDVKIQIEFNPQEIAAYRLLGYENRVLAAEDFANDKKDAGEIGAGHTVTALYELVPVGAALKAAPAAAEQLKYQATGDRGQEPGAVGNALRGVLGTANDVRLTDAAKSGELLTLKLRYKEPEGTESKLIEYPLKDRGGSFHAASRDLQFAASVASFGMILRGSEHRGSGNLPAVLEIAAGALGNDPGGYRAELVDLVRKAQALGAK